ncbi:hypothetical protein MPSEU_000921600 [Mayamaea pseudoterrestris]|nr:hypothetical protein MPSEU_000921600 [Mayamaea pseudoterrestris]
MKKLCALLIVIHLIHWCVASTAPLLRGNHHDQHESIINYNVTLVVPLHEKSGTMHLNMYVGQPSVKKTLIVDTGSRLAAWKCDHATNNKETNSHQLENTFSSTTLQTIQCDSCQYPGAVCSNNDACQLTQKYTEGSSWTATEVTDLVSLELLQDDIIRTMIDQDALDTSGIIFRFGCQTQLTGLFQRQYADGILGLEQSPHSLVRQLHRQQLLPSNSFSLCLGGSSDDSENSGSGLLGLGGSLQSRHLHTMKYTPLVRRDKAETGLYVVQVVQVWIGGTCVACHDDRWVRAFATGPGTVLDSGTTDTYLPMQLSEEFARVWEKESGFSYYKRTKRYSYDEFLRLPDIRFVFKGNVTLQALPLAYMEGALSTRWTGRRELSNRIHVNEPKGAVLGMNVQRNHDIHYEADRIGFAKADCRPKQQGDAVAA